MLKFFVTKQNVYISEFDALVMSVKKFHNEREMEREREEDGFAFDGNKCEFGCRHF